MDLFASRTLELLGPFLRGIDRADTEPDRWSEKTIKDLLATGLVKPLNTDDISRRLARLYVGNGRAIVSEELQRRYPRSANVMPNAPMAYPRLWARSDAGAYASPASRYLVGDDGQPIPTDSEQAASFAEVLDLARHQEVMTEVEQRAMCGVRTAFVHVGWFPAIDDEPGRCLLHIYWPHDIAVITLPQHPSEEQAIIFLALRQTAPGQRERWVAYKRDIITNDGADELDLGGWQRTIYTQDDNFVEWEEHGGKMLPVASLRIEQPDGGFWPPVNRDALDQAVGLNVNRSNLEYVTDIQAHSQMVISSDTYDEKDQPVGPGSTVKLRSGETAQWITPSPDFDAMRANVEEKQRSIATINGNNPNAYSSTTQQPESGIARVIANIPHEQRLKSLRPVVARFDERVCRLIMDTHDAFDPDRPIFGVLRPRVDLGDSPAYEDPEAKQRRALVDLDAGVISLAEYAVETGRYETVDDAVAAGLPDVPRAAEQQGAGGPPANLNEITLGIERLARSGDVDGVNALRDQLASLFGVELAPTEAVSAPALPGTPAAPQAEAVLEQAAQLEPEDEADLDEVTG
jgi:hypothetical protein